MKEKKRVLNTLKEKLKNLNLVLYLRGEGPTLSIPHRNVGFRDVMYDLYRMLKIFADYELLKFFKWLTLLNINLNLQTNQVSLLVI